MPLDTSKEPRWVTRVVRLFPHPLFALVVSLACLAVALLFTLMAVLEGIWPLGIVGAAFGVGAYLIAAATIVRRRHRRRLSAQRSQLFEATDSRPDPSEQMAADEPRGLSVPTSHLLLYLATVILWEVQIVIFVARVFVGVRVADAWRYAVIAAYILLTLLSVRFGRLDLQRVRKSGGKVELTRVQTALVVCMIVSFAAAVVTAYNILGNLP